MGVAAAAAAAAVGGAGGAGTAWGGEVENVKKNKPKQMEERKTLRFFCCEIKSRDFDLRIMHSSEPYLMSCSVADLMS